MGIGRHLDKVAGGLSRLLHVRPAKHNTVSDLDRYLDLRPEQLFPEVPRLTSMRIRRGIIARSLRTTTLTWESAHEILCPTYLRRYQRDYKRNRIAYARWVQPDGRRRKRVLIYVHGWLEPGSWVEETTLFRKWTKELGVDIVHLCLPFHGQRTPRTSLFSGEFFWTADLVRSLEGVRQAVCDARSLIGWLRDQGYEQVGVSGISLGGAITMTLGCLSQGPDYVVPIISHLELEDAVEEAGILWRMRTDLERWGIDSEQRREIFQRIGLSKLRPKLSSDEQLWIEAREDGYIDAKLVERQWHDWGKPNILWIDGGHMTFPLHLNEMTDRMGAFIDGVSSRDS